MHYIMNESQIFLSYVSSMDATIVATYFKMGPHQPLRDHLTLGFQQNQSTEESSYILLVLWSRSYQL